MNRVVSCLRSVKLRQIVIIFVISVTILLSSAVDSHGNQLQAQAEPVTPEATDYQTERTNSQLGIDTDKVKEKAKDTQQATQAAGNNLIDNIREKLNLDEPIDPGTKQAVKQLRSQISK